MPPLAVELVARHDEHSQLTTTVAIQQYLRSVSPEEARQQQDRLREHDAATKIQARWRGISKRQEEVYTFLIEREQLRERSWDRQWEEAQQLKTHAEQLFQEGEEKLKQARKFAASAQTNRMAGVDGDASLQKWRADTQRETKRLADTQQQQRRSTPSTSYLHASFDDVDAAKSKKKSKPKPVASHERLVALSSEHHKREAKLRAKKIALDKARAAVSTTRLPRNRPFACDFGSCFERLLVITGGSEALHRLADSNRRIVIQRWCPKTEAIHRCCGPCAAETPAGRRPPARVGREGAIVGNLWLLLWHHLLLILFLITVAPILWLTFGRMSGRNETIESRVR
jgi:hypothetical protein